MFLFKAISNGLYSYAVLTWNNLPVMEHGHAEGLTLSVGPEICLETK